LCINNIQNYSEETQIFSNVFTEELIKEALDKKYDIIIEGTMRNPETPLKTAEQLKNAGFRGDRRSFCFYRDFRIQSLSGRS
jgi:hypothetical protein